MKPFIAFEFQYFLFYFLEWRATNLWATAMGSAKHLQCMNQLRNTFIQYLYILRCSEIWYFSVRNEGMSSKIFAINLWWYEMCFDSNSHSWVVSACVARPMLNSFTLPPQSTHTHVEVTSTQTDVSWRHVTPSNRYCIAPARKSCALVAGS